VDISADFIPEPEHAYADSRKVVPGGDWNTEMFIVPPEDDHWWE
jgi:hypothetical protein